MHKKNTSKDCDNRDNNNNNGGDDDDNAVVLIFVLKHVK